MLAHMPYTQVSHLCVQAQTTTSGNSAGKQPASPHAEPLADDMEKLSAEDVCAMMDYEVEITMRFAQDSEVARLQQEQERLIMLEQQIAYDAQMHQLASNGMDMLEQHTHGRQAARMGDFFAQQAEPQVVEEYPLLPTAAASSPASLVAAASLAVAAAVERVVVMQRRLRP